MCELGWFLQRQSQNGNSGTVIHSKWMIHNIVFIYFHAALKC